VVVRRVLKRSHFESVDHLKQRLLDFIDYFNETMANPWAVGKLQLTFHPVWNEYSL
jgi:hypothetical protein